ncbi:hypothetical protein R5R35_012647 [Gryllus longicercus]|uniref:Targeting protein for Xklp2 n=1 Tax=Gryllus longicercus TaxID=2509291 RepID=A0AAN9VDJ7_9ORTH
MAYEYNVPHMDFVEKFHQDDGADAFFDIHEQLENKLSLNESEELESRNEEIPTVSHSEDDALTCVTCLPDLEKRENGVLQEITGSVQNIGENRKRKSDVDHKIMKFISLAEGVKEFQGHIRSTYHSQSQKIGGKNKNYSSISKFHVTIPQSPMLLSKTRTRPVNYPSAEERAQKEIEEIESFKLKAKPVNKKIFEPPQLGRRVPRAPLVVEPFNLTEYKRKETKESSPFQFKAKPVPKGMLQHPLGVPDKIVLPVTSPHTPSFVAKHRSKMQTIEEINGKLAVVDKSPVHSNVPIVKMVDKTLPQPFSFEERDKLMMKNKEEKIKKVLQEEKEARIFHANPVPTYIKKCTKEMCNESRSPSRVTLPNDQEKNVPFKAQPATVLLKEPFKPKYPERSFTQPGNVTLHTEHRALSRKEYDEYLKLRADEIEAERQRRKELEMIKQEKEVALLRQQAVHKAQPIRSYRPIPDRPRTAVTSPATPKFSKRFNK